MTDRDSPIEPAALQMLRHVLATLAYRAAKAVRGAPDGFGDARASANTRSAVAIIAHMGDLMEWAVTLARGQFVWKEKQPGPWDDEVGRFFKGLGALDAQIAANPPAVKAAEKLLQGPIADALTHTGQITVLRRIAGSPVRGESYALAEIRVGTVGLDQPAPRKEFD